MTEVQAGEDTVEYIYNAANKLTEVKYPDGTYVKYGYDAFGGLYTGVTAPYTQNRYAYVGNNPINRWDPLGYWEDCILFSIGI